MQQWQNVTEKNVPEERTGGGWGGGMGRTGGEMGGGAWRRGVMLIYEIHIYTNYHTHKYNNTKSTKETKTKIPKNIQKYYCHREECSGREDLGRGEKGGDGGYEGDSTTSRSCHIDIAAL